MWLLCSVTHQYCRTVSQVLFHTLLPRPYRDRFRLPCSSLTVFISCKSLQGQRLSCIRWVSPQFDVDCTWHFAIIRTTSRFDNRFIQFSIASFHFVYPLRFRLWSMSWKTMTLSFERIFERFTWISLRFFKYMLLMAKSPLTLSESTMRIRTFVIQRRKFETDRNVSDSHWPTVKPIGENKWHRKRWICSWLNRLCFYQTMAIINFIHPCLIHFVTEFQVFAAAVEELT